MAQPAKAGVPIVGGIFLMLGLYKLAVGENWVVWIILGFLFGGLGFFTRTRAGADRT